MIIDLQRRIMEAGRIRLGQVVPTGNGKTRPAKLDTFRLTSADRQRIDQAAQLFGGTPREWTAPAGKQWEVVTERAAIDVIVPPSEMAFSQHYELWSAGGCQRRCDSVFDQISDGPCLCDADARECDIHTRLSVMIRDLPGLGVWRVDTQGYYSAVELAAAVQVIAAAAGRGVLLPARLLLLQRSVIRRGEDGKPQTRRFPVVGLDVEVTPGQLLGGMSGATAIEGVQTLDSLSEPDRPALLSRVPDSVPEWPVPSVAEQINAVVAEPPKRSNAQQPIPATGLEPRTVEEVGTPLTLDDAIDDPWSELVPLLKSPPGLNATMVVIEEKLRLLYSLMDNVGLWPGDKLHPALKKHANALHVSELRKDALLEFCRVSWEAAQRAANERPM